MNARCDVGDLEDSINSFLDSLESGDFTTLLQPLALGFFTLRELMTASDSDRLCRQAVQDGLGNPCTKLRWAACQFSFGYRRFLADDERSWAIVDDGLQSFPSPSFYNLHFCLQVQETQSPIVPAGRQYKRSTLGNWRLEVSAIFSLSCVELLTNLVPIPSVPGRRERFWAVFDDGLRSRSVLPAGSTREAPRKTRGSWFGQSFH